MADYYAIYDDAGAIRAVGRADGNNEVMAPPGFSRLSYDHRPDAKTEYIDIETSEKHQRPTFDTFDKTEIAADGTDAATLNNLPAGAVITIDASSWTVNDGVFVFKTTTPATYSVRVEKWPYQPYETEIVAT